MDHRFLYIRPFSNKIP